MMSRAQLIGLAKPLQRRVSCRQDKWGLRQAGLNPEERLGNLRFEWMNGRLESKQPGKVSRKNCLEAGFPAECRG